MFKSLLLSAYFVLCLCSVQCFGWGAKGHKMVAEIAFSYLDDATRQTVQKYLGNTSFEQASTWMDEMRSDHYYDYMKPWHYMNIEKGKDYVPTKEDNIVNILNKKIDELKHREKLSDDEIKKNIMVIFHLVGDFHMPLHVGYGEDKGGNTIQVTYLDHDVNLHKVWDSEIIESEKISLSDCLLQKNNFDKNKLDQLRVINIEQWIPQPRHLLTEVYEIKDNKIDRAYIEKNKPVVEQQIFIAGIRLASVLESVFSSSKN